MRPCFKKIKTITTTAFLTSNTVVPNPYNHSAAFDLQSFTPLSEVPVSLIDMSRSNIQILYDIQIDNGILQRVNSSWTGILKDKVMVHGEDIDSLHRFSFQFIKNGSTAT